MRKVFEQSEHTMSKEGIYVYCNNNNEVFMGGLESEHSPYFVFTPDEAILFAMEVIKVAEKIKNNKE